VKPYYEENGVTIYHGDCREILPRLQKVDLVLTDPPYGVGFSYWSESYVDNPDGYWDKMAPIVELFMQKGELVFITPGIRNISLYPKPKWILSWGKPGSTRRNDTGGFNCWEPVLFYGSHKLNQDFIYLPDCVNHSDFAGHPCPKPLRLFKWLIEQSAAGTVLDPFMGSGTTLRAAKDLGRSAIGIDIEERYCEIAAKRLAQEVLPL
jgi:site-specific DNA-methyltransferase (adenine-specific)